MTSAAYRPQVVVSRVLRSFLFEVKPSDPTTLIVVGALFVGVGLLACGHVAKLQPQSLQVSAAPGVRLLAVPLHWNFRRRFGVPVLASNTVVAMDIAGSGHPKKQPSR